MDSNLTSVSNQQKTTKQPKQQPVDKTAVKQAVKPEEEKQVSSTFFKEAEPRVIEKKDFKAPPEVKEWIKEVKTAEEITLPQPVKDEYGQILVKAAAPVRPKIVLPLSQPKVKQGLHKKVAESVRWLAEWCLRIIKMFPKRVSYGSSS